MSSQVLTKASKIIPVMIMGKVVSARKYETYEYVVALLISVGMTLFLFGSQADRADSSGVTTFTGVILLVGECHVNFFKFLQFSTRNIKGNALSGLDLGNLCNCTKYIIPIQIYSSKYEMMFGWAIN